MATPIQPTPVLEGKDAERFIKEITRKKTPEEKRKYKKRLKQAEDSWKNIKFVR